MRSYGGDQRRVGLPDSRVWVRADQRFAAGQLGLDVGEPLGQPDSFGAAFVVASTPNQERHLVVPRDRLERTGMDLTTPAPLLAGAIDEERHGDAYEREHRPEVAQHVAEG